MKIKIIIIEGDREEVSGMLHDFNPDEFRVKLNKTKVHDITGEAKKLKQKIDAVSVLDEALKDVLEIVKDPIEEGDGKTINEDMDIPVKKKEKKNVDWTKYHKPSTRSRDKICQDCGSLFHDDTKTNTRKWCDTCSPKHHGKNREIEESKKEDIRDKICEYCGDPFHDTSSNNNRKHCDKCRFTHGYRSQGKTSPKPEPIKPEKKPKAPREYKKPIQQVKPPAKVKIDNSQNGQYLKPPANNRPPVVLNVNEKICANKKCKSVFVQLKLDQKYCSSECALHDIGNYPPTHSDEKKM